MHHIVSRFLLLGAIIVYSILAPTQSTVLGQTVPPTASAPAASTDAKPGVPGNERSLGTSSGQPTLFTRTKPYEGLRIGSGDLLRVSVFGAADYNHDVRVADDGTVILPLIGEMHAAGLTTRQLAADLQSRLSQGGFFNNPQVGVFVREYATQGVSVLGEVKMPGVYPLLGARTLFDLISAAQGTTQAAGNQVSIIHRDRPQQPEIVKLTYDVKGAAQSNVPVLPGDTIIVQRASMMYVVGNVQKPTGIAMVDPGLTVLKAIALAQGIAPNAALDKARLVRKTSDGEIAIPLQLKKMLAAQVPDMRVEPEDILFIPNSMASSAFKKGLELALQTASGVVIYHQY